MDPAAEERATIPICRSGTDRVPLTHLSPIASLDMRVLVVEDNPALGTQLQRGLRELWHSASARVRKVCGYVPMNPGLCQRVVSQLDSAITRASTDVPPP